jgi:hypothetical protein
MSIISIPKPLYRVSRIPLGMSVVEGFLLPSLSISISAAFLGWTEVPQVKISAAA